MRTPALALSVGMTVATFAANALAQDTLPPDAKIEIAPQPPEPKVQAEGVHVDEPPPLRPHKKGLVLESSVGALGFVGDFRHVAPTAYWLHGLLGYEINTWLMLLGEAELAYTDTSESVDLSHVAVFPIWGFGGGARATFHASERVATFVQGNVDAIGAAVPHDTLAIYGFRSVESLAPAYGVRVGLEWYQLDRHLALSVQVGARYASSFDKFLATSDIPVLWDAALCLRYTF